LRQPTGPQLATDGGFRIPEEKPERDRATQVWRRRRRRRRRRRGRSRRRVY